MKRLAAAMALMLVLAGVAAASTADGRTIETGSAEPDARDDNAPRTGTTSAEILFHTFNLFGAWAPNCKAAASPDNPHVEIGLPQPGMVLEQHDLGPAYAHNRYVMLSARRESRSRLAVEALFQQGQSEPQRQHIVFRIAGKTRRTLFTETEGEPPRVKNGIAVAAGKPTPLLVKCE
jgi:hypothetical protein